MPPHEQRTEDHSSTQFSEGFRERLSTRRTERPVCRVCWLEDDDGTPRRADWGVAPRTSTPSTSCPTVRAREAVMLNSMVLSGEDHSDRSRAAVRRALED